MEKYINNTDLSKIFIGLTPLKEAEDKKYIYRKSQLTGLAEVLLYKDFEQLFVSYLMKESVTPSPDFADVLTDDEKELWSIAKTNTRRNAVLHDITKAVAAHRVGLVDQMAEDFSSLEEINADKETIKETLQSTIHSTPIYVATLNDNQFGAGVVADKEILDHICKLLKSEKIFLIPDNRHSFYITDEDDKKRLLGIQALLDAITDEKERLFKGIYEYNSSDKSYTFNMQFE